MRARTRHAPNYHLKRRITLSYKACTGFIVRLSSPRLIYRPEVIEHKLHARLAKSLRGRTAVVRYTRALSDFFNPESFYDWRFQILYYARLNSE